MERYNLDFYNRENLQKCKEKFLEFIDVGEETLKSYNSGVKQFIQYLDENNITTPTRENVIEFRTYQKEKNSVATANAYLSAIKAFFEFLEYNNIYKNITKNVKHLKDTTLHKKKFFTADICRELQTKYCGNLREEVMFVLTLTTGIRINELVNIRLEDFKVINDKICLYVLGKARQYKQDYVIVDKYVYELIKRYVEEYDINDYLFVSNSNHNKGGKITTHSARRIVNRIFERANIKDDKTTFHSIRHSFATISISNGATTRDVCKALRQTSTVVTERYLHDLENINNMCSGIVTSQLLGN